jgi:hypothetical protein
MTLKQALTKEELKAIAANMDKIVQHFQTKGGKIK